MKDSSIPFELTIGNTIEFNNKCGGNPLMPLVQASYSDSNRDIIQISVNVFINESVRLSKENLIITQDSNNQYLFFIEYIKDNKTNAVRRFRNYRLDFEIKNLNADTNHGELVIYLKDEDPTLSRGTVTTVLHTR
ncbi:hypothetical protein [Chryseobacterium sp. FH1]|uniref:hypothetical protein n=1 Tax=Chryseobacterium sp. FH1 TaxID=1233951 RepID=UPI0004E3035B|nr:hypothetical protein [Chryseobacterium sp. FH1]KFC19660.1 hypothetical protein IO90_10325 [Chryseobacterium sp. FH1]